MCSLLHTSACLLIRPSLLTIMINQKSNGKQTQDAQEEMSRVRRLSSTEQEDRYFYFNHFAMAYPVLWETLINLCKKFEQSCKID